MVRSFNFTLIKTGIKRMVLNMVSVLKREHFREINETWSPIVKIMSV